MAYVELGQDNGGILLNLGEGGFAVQSALALTSREFPELRFQVPSLQGWLTASGRIVWISDSKKEAGIQFTELPGEARTEIQKWVAAEGTPEKSRERIPGGVPPPVPAPSPAAARPPITDPRDSGVPRQSFEAPYRGNGGVYEAGVAYNSRANGTTPEKEKETVGAAMTETSSQGFQFTDYSMFAAAPEQEVVWAQQPRRKGGWRGVMLAVLMAAAFFTLGATVGRETVNRWVAYVGAWTQSQFATAPVPKTMPPTAPDQAPPADASNDLAAKPTTSEEQAQAKSGGETPGANAGPVENSENAKVATEGKSDVEAKVGKTEGVSGGSARDAASENAGASSTRSANSTGSNERRAGRVTERIISRENRQPIADPSRTSDHSILVNAPEPGSAPFFVNFSNEAVSASGAIAMSARRSLEILPRSSAAASAAQRVVIGKLIVHSEPFYPAEARSRGVEGSVELRAKVGRTGQVVGVTPLSGPWLLFPAAVAAVREWRYEPTYVNGDPVETSAEITIVFRLR